MPQVLAIRDVADAAMLSFEEGITVRATANHASQLMFATNQSTITLREHHSRFGSSSSFLLDFVLTRLKVPVVPPIDKQESLYQRIDKLAETDPSLYSNDPNQREKYSTTQKKALCDEFYETIIDQGGKVLQNLVKHDEKAQHIPRAQSMLFELKQRDFWIEASGSNLSSAHLCPHPTCHCRRCKQ